MKTSTTKNDNTTTTIPPTATTTTAPSATRTASLTTPIIITNNTIATMEERKRRRAETLELPPDAVTAVRRGSNSRKSVSTILGSLYMSTTNKTANIGTDYEDDERTDPDNYRDGSPQPCHHDSSPLLRSAMASSMESSSSLVSSHDDILEWAEKTLKQYNDQRANDELATFSHWFTWRYLTFFLALFVLIFSVLVMVSDDPGQVDAHLDGKAKYTCTSLVFIFALLLITDINNCYQQISQLKQQVCMVVCFVNGIALFTNVCLQFHWTPVLTDCFGRSLYPIRYLEWTFTTPCLLFLIHRLVFSMRFPGKTHGLDKSLVTLLLCEIAMLITGFLGSYLSNPLMRLLSIILSFVFFMPVVLILNYEIQDCLNGLTAKFYGSIQSLQFLRVVIFLTWSSFPVVWLISGMDLISIENEAVAYGLCDLGAKFCLSVLLVSGNFAVLDHMDTVQRIRITEDNRRLGAMNRKVELDSRLQRNFFAISAHELRTPLNSIIVFNELVLDMETAPLKQEYLLSSLTSAKALLSVINNVLDFTKYESGDWELDNTEFHLYQLLDDVIDIVSARVSREGIHLEVTCTSCRDKLLFGDMTRLRQVLLNLVSNAIKFSKQGSDIYLDVHLVSESEDCIELEFAVIDQGVGMAPDSLERIFHPFFQVSETSHKQDGTGLGLVICKSIVGKMNGDIDVKSTVDYGSEFSFRIPVKKVREADHYLEFEQGKIDRTLIITPRVVFGEFLGDLLVDWGSGKVEIICDVPPDHKLGDYNLIVVDISTASWCERPDFERLAKGYQTNCLFLIPLMETENIAKLVSVKQILSKPMKFSSLYNAISHLKDKTRRPNSSNHQDSILQNNYNPSKKDFRILIVEDNQTNQKVAMAILAREGYSYHLATNGVEAIEKVGQNNYDVILMDLNMPRLNGLEASKLIRESETNWRNHIIALTADSTDETKRQCMAHGMDDVIIKPISTKHLSAVLDVQFKQKRSQTSNKASET